MRMRKFRYYLKFLVDTYILYAQLLTNYNVKLFNSDRTIKNRDQQYKKCSLQCYIII